VSPTGTPDALAGLVLTGSPMLTASRVVLVMTVGWSPCRTLTTSSDCYIATAQGVADSYAVAVARMVGRAPSVPAGS
jgi:hypothetical protein